MTRKVKVLQIVGAGKAGGAETFAVRLLTALARHKEVEVLVVARSGGWVAKRMRAGGVEVAEAAFGGLFDLLTGWRVARLARRFQPDVVMGWMNRGARFVPKGPWARCARLGGFYNLKNYFGKVDDLVCNTKDICDYCVAGGWPVERVWEIGNFIPALPKGWRNGREAMRKRLHFGEKQVVLMMAGRIHAVKGVDVALRALAELPKHVVLMVVGEGALRQEMEALALELGVDKRVRWLGWADSVSAFAAAADVWIAPSRHEPLGNTVLDGWAHEVPVVASAVGGMKGLIDDGVSGLLVAPEDERALAAAVRRLEGDVALRRKLARGGKARLQQDFSEEKIVGDYVAYYKRLAKERKKA